MELFEAFSSLGTGQLILLLIALVIAFGFECINGFHDTANAVATVIYTKSMKPTWAVVWSGIWNFIGVHAGGIGVAFSIVHLLPVDLLVNIKTGRGLAMVLSLLGAAIIWNFHASHLTVPLKTLMPAKRLQSMQISVRPQRPVKKFVWATSHLRVLAPT